LEYKVNKQNQKYFAKTAQHRLQSDSGCAAPRKRDLPEYAIMVVASRPSAAAAEPIRWATHLSN